MDRFEKDEFSLESIIAEFGGKNAEGLEEEKSQIETQSEIEPEIVEDSAPEEQPQGIEEVPQQIPAAPPAEERQPEKPADVASSFEKEVTAIVEQAFPEVEKAEKAKRLEKTPEELEQERLMLEEQRAREKAAAEEKKAREKLLLEKARREQAKAEEEEEKAWQEERQRRAKERAEEKAKKAELAEQKAEQRQQRRAEKAEHKTAGYDRSYDFLNVSYKESEPAVKFFKRKTRGMTLRFIISLIVSAAAVYLTLAPTYGLFVPFGISPTEKASIIRLALLVMNALCVLLAFEVTAAGLWRLLILRPTLDSLVLFSALASMLHCGLGMVVSGLDDFTPYCCVSCVVLTVSLLAKRFRSNGLKRLYKLSQMGVNPKGLKVLDGGKVYISVKCDQPAQQDVSGYSAYDRTERASCVFSPIIIVACLVLALIASVGRKNASLFFWCLAAISSVAVSCAMIVSTAAPWASSVKRLFQSGVIMPDDRLAASLSACRFAGIQDNDLFPAGSVEIESFERGDGIVTEDTAIICADALMSRVGGGVAEALSDFMKKRCYMSRVPADVEYYETGGISGQVGSYGVLVGTASFLSRMGCRMPRNEDPTTVFVAVDREYAGGFKLKYVPQETVRTAFRILRRSKVRAALTVKDFNVSEPMVQSMFKLRKEDTDFPDLSQRIALSERDVGKDLPVCAVMTRDSILSYAETLRVSRNLTTSSRFNLICALIASLFGMLIMYFLCCHVESSSASVLNVLLYQALWLVPMLTVSLLTSN